MFQFPFGNMQELNLDWFLAKFKEYVDAWHDFKDSVEGSIADVFNARDAAINAKNDAVSAKNDAVTAKTAADADALKSEGFAVGEQNGTPVASGSPYYQKNSKYYSIESGTYRYLSEAYARGEMGGVPVSSGEAGYEDNAKYYKELTHADYEYVHDHVTDADASALEAEGYAVGEQNGTPVASGSPYYENNAKYYAGEAQQDKDDADHFKDAANNAALVAEGYSSGTQNGTPVGALSPYYENNAAYYSGLAAAGSGLALCAIPFFDDFSYSDDGTYSTLATQQQITFTKNKLTYVRLGSSSTYYCMGLFGSHVRTSGNPVTYRVDDLIPLPVLASDPNTDILLITKLTGHTTGENNVPQIRIGTYNENTNTWNDAAIQLVAPGSLQNYRCTSFRKILPQAFVNGNFSAVCWVRSGATCNLEYSFIIAHNYN